MWERKKDYTGPSSRHTEQYNKPSKEYKINNNSNIMTIIIWLIIWCLFCGGAPWCELPWQVYEQFFSFFIHFKSVLLIYFCQKLSIKKNSLNFGRVHQMTFYSLFFFFFFLPFFFFWNSQENIYLDHCTNTLSTQDCIKLVDIKIYKISDMGDGLFIIVL